MKNAVTFLSKTYDDDKLKNITAAIDVALNGRSLDVDTMQVELTTPQARLGFLTSENYPFYTSDDKWFTTSETNSGIGEWNRDEPLVLLRGGSQYSIGFPNAVTRSGATSYRISCTSALGKLTQLSHKGGIYSGTKAGPLLREICGYVNGEPAAGVEIYVAPEYENQELYGWLPYLSPTGENGADTGSARDNLMQVLFAITGSLRDDANGVLRVETLSPEPSANIGSDKIYANGARVVEEQPVTSVTVLEHKYVVGEDEVTLFDGQTTAGQVIIFYGPMANLVATGFSITESGANYAIVSAGTGTLTGTPYIDTTREITRSITAAAVPNTERVERATLVSTANSWAVVERLAAYYSHRKRIECYAIIEQEDAGDVVSIWDPFDRVMRDACIESISPLVVSGVMKGYISALVGFTPWQTSPYANVHVLIDESGTYTFPDDLNDDTEIIAVLIGGGQGGMNGSAGQNGTGGTSKYVLTGLGSYAVANGVGGAGGAGGAGGVGGNVFIVSFLVGASDSASITIGSGGAAGGNSGGNTTVTINGVTYTSASGDSVTYTDPDSGTVYGVYGRSGVNGGAGGNGGATMQRGANGQDTESYTGGSGGRSGVANGTDYGGLFTAWLLRGGGGGGGASGAANGINGTDATGTVAGDLSSVSNGNGGNGANGGSAAVPVNYGDGGNGGHGGGGGGGAGATSLSVSRVYEEYLPCRITANANTYGTGGAGGSATAGKQGCVILFYRRPVSE